MNNSGDGIFDALLPDSGQEQPEVSAVEAEESAEVVETETEVEVDESIESEVSEADEASEEDSSEDMVYEIEGKQYTLKQLEEMEQGGLRQADYTKKTQKLSESQKEVDAAKAQLGEKIESLDSKVAEIDKLVADAETTTDWDLLRDTDPSEYLRQRELLKGKQEAAEKAKAEIASLKEEQFNAKVAEERVKLLEALPEWNDPATLEKDSQMIADYMESNGFEESDVKDMVNHKFYLAIRKAALYDSVQSKAGDVAKQVSKAPKVVKASKKTNKKQGSSGITNPHQSLANALYS